MDREKQKQQLAVIDFSKFSATQLPELKGKKEEITSVIDANPIVEIKDNASYELAKKSRTAVRTLRTSLESEQKTVKKKIKEHVLDVVDKEYDTLILGVKSAEQSRQAPIDVWEEKKEKEKQEKARLEQERIDGIKNKISDYVASWKEVFGLMVFGSIKEVCDNFNESNANFDKTDLREFDVLFDHEILILNELLNSKISTLKEQEQIRIDNLIIQEKNAEQSRIQEWQRGWNANIDSLSFSNIADVKSVLVKSKLANLKHYVSGYDEIYISIEKRLHSQIEFVSKAEEQRITQEKLDQEKKEFDEKQSEAKFQERKKFLVDEDYWRIYLLAECREEEDVAKSKLLSYDDNEFENFKLRVLKAKEQVKAIEFVAEETIEFSNLEVETDTDASSNSVNNQLDFSNYEEEVKHIEQVKEVKSEETWDNIYSLFSDQNQLKKDLSIKDVFEWLKKQYNVPTKKL